MATCRTLTSAVALLACTTASFAQAPANDDCANAAVIGLGVTAFDTTNATTDGQLLDVLVCDMGAFGDEQIHNDIWYCFTAPNTDNYDVTTFGLSGFDTRLAVYDNACGVDDPALVVACNDDFDGAAPFEAGLTFAATAATDYKIRVGGYDALTAGGGGVLIQVNVPVVGPTNDDCANAAVIGTGTTAYDTTGATTDGQVLDPLVCDMGFFGTEQIEADIWYCFTAPTTDDYDVTTFGLSGYDTRLAVYDNNCGPDDPALVVACNDDFDGGTPFEAGLDFPAVMGTSYKIRVGGFVQGENGPGAVLIQVHVPVVGAPPNDDCVNAAAIGLGMTAFDNTLASTDGVSLDPLVCDMGPFGTDQIDADLWYCFMAPATDNYDVTTFGLAGFDSRLAVYDNGCGPDDPALVISCNDDFDGNAPFEAGLTFAAVMGTSYKIRLGGFTGADTGMGNVLVQVNVPIPPPANDDCANAEVITAFGVYPWDTTAASTDGADLAGFCDIGIGDDIVHNDVWFEYTPDVGGCTYLSTLGLAGFDTKIAVYNSSTCPDDPATVIACSDEEIQPIAGPFEAGMDVDLVAGTTYLIRVGGFNAAADGPGSLFIGAGPVAVNNDGGMQTGAPGCAGMPVFPEGCNGDGGDQLGCTDCPCGNNAPIGTIGGCLNSALTSTRLLPSGDTSVSLPSGDTTDLRFGVAGAPPTAFCILNSGDNVAPQGMANPCFGLNSGAQSATFDGLRCAVQNTLRHGGRSADLNGDVGVTNNPWGGEGGPPVGLAVAGMGFSSGQTRYFQVIHRDDPLAVCGRGLNTTQSVEVTFTP